MLIALIIIVREIQRTDNKIVQTQYFNLSSYTTLGNLLQNNPVEESLNQTFYVTMKIFQGQLGSV